jgi:hypothetical protein
VLVFERLWEETGCRNVIADLAGARGHKFALERAVFLTVLHRLFRLAEPVRFQATTRSGTRTLRDIAREQPRSRIRGSHLRRRVDHGACQHQVGVELGVESTTYTGQ